MFTQKTQRLSDAQQTLEEVHQLRSRLFLKLPASRTSVYQQRQRLIQVRQRLELLQTKIFIFNNSNQLTDLVESSIHEAINLIHLAEEYPFDPEGTVSCLQSLELPVSASNP